MGIEQRLRDAGQLKQAGADRVLLPYADAAAEAVDYLFGEVIQTVSESTAVVKPEE